MRMTINSLKILDAEHCEQIEQTVIESLSADIIFLGLIKLESCAYFTISVKDTEKAVIVVEALLVSNTAKHKNDALYNEIAIDIATSLLTKHQLDAYSIIIIKENSIPRLTNGGIDRSRTKLAYLEGNLKELYYWNKYISDNNIIDWQLDSKLKSVPNKSVPFMVDGWEVLNAAIKRNKRLLLNPSLHKTNKSIRSSLGAQTGYGRLPPEFFHKFAINATLDKDSNTYTFPDNSALLEAPLSRIEQFFLFIFSLPIYSFFIWIPAGVYILFRFLPLFYAWSLFIAIFTFVYTYPAASSWPPDLRYFNHWFMVAGFRYFSYRILVEEFIDHNIAPAIYAMGPHGVAFALAPSLQAAFLNEFVLGESLHTLAASVTFYIPFYNLLLKVLGFISVDKKSFVSALKKGRSVGLVPGGISEMFVCSYGNDKETLAVRKRKGFIKIALETGSQIVPCYCFGNSQTFTSGSGSFLRSMSRLLRASIVLFWGRFYLPIPHRVPMLTVIGRPIKCPKIENPSPEIINDFHEQYLLETRRIYYTYRNMYGWEKKPLIFSK